MNDGEKAHLLQRAAAERDRAIAQANERYRLRVETIEWACGAGEAIAADSPSADERPVTRVGPAGVSPAPVPAAGRNVGAVNISGEVSKAMPQMPTEFDLDDIYDYLSSRLGPISRQAVSTALKRAKATGIVRVIKPGDNRNPAKLQLVKQPRPDSGTQKGFA